MSETLAGSEVVRELCLEGVRWRMATLEGLRLTAYACQLHELSPLTEALRGVVGRGDPPPLRSLTVELGDNPGLCRSPAGGEACRGQWTELFLVVAALPGLETLSVEVPAPPAGPAVHGLVAGLRRGRSPVRDVRVRCAAGEPAAAAACADLCRLAGLRRLGIDWIDPSGGAEPRASQGLCAALLGLLVAASHASAGAPSGLRRVTLGVAAAVADDVEGKLARSLGSRGDVVPYVVQGLP